MVIEKVHGLHATTISLNDRFTMLTKVAPDRILRQQQQRQQQQQRRLNSLGPSIAQNYRLVEQLTRKLQSMQAKRAIKLRLGLAQSGLRRFGSEGNLPRLRRANSFGNLSQLSTKDRVSWRQSNGNLSRSASFGNLANTWRGFRRRGGGQRQLRGRFRGRGVGRGRGGIVRANIRQQRPQMARRARGGARGRGGVTRNQQTPQKQVTKEELDHQLDQYMAGTKAALDLELDNYMKNAMEME